VFGGGLRGPGNGKGGLIVSFQLSAVSYERSAKTTAFSGIRSTSLRTGSEGVAFRKTDFSIL
jgi:hypothetical protein